MGEYVEMNILIVETQKVSIAARMEYQRLCMPAHDNHVLNGVNEPTLKGLALDEEELRLFHVSSA